MNSLINQSALIGGTCFITGYLLAKYENTIAFAAFNAYADTKIAIFGLPKVTNTELPNAVHKTNGFIFNHYNDTYNQPKFTQWFPDTPEGRDQAAHSNIMSLSFNNYPAKFAFIKQSPYGSDINQRILNFLSELAGPEGDFDDNIPTLKVLSALVGVELSTPIHVESDNCETFCID